MSIINKNNVDTTKQPLFFSTNFTLINILHTYIIIEMIVRELTSKNGLFWH